MDDTQKNRLIETLIKHNCIKFGQFKLKSGDISDYYVDLRESTDYMDSFRLIVELVKEYITTICLNDNSIQPKVIVGIPYGVVPVAAAVAYACNIPYHAIRKEVKNYGNTVDSNLTKDSDHILIEDVMSTGSSIIETIQKLSDKTITDVIIIVNRKQGGDEKLKELYPSIKVHSIIDASQILDYHKLKS